MVEYSITGYYPAKWSNWICIILYRRVCPARVWPHFRIEPFERARTRKRISSFAFDNHLPNEKHVRAVAYQLTVHLFYIDLY